MSIATTFKQPRPLGLLAAILLLLAGTAFGQEAPPAGLQARLDALFAEAALPGVSAAVALPDGTVIPLVAGFADREAKRAMAPGDLLMQGSVGKTYVAAVALQLVSEGKLALNCGPASSVSLAPNCRSSFTRSPLHC